MRQGGYQNPHYITSSNSKKFELIYINNTHQTQTSSHPLMLEMLIRLGLNQIAIVHNNAI